MVSENRKLYFYDLGIRNALVKDFRETRLRPDQADSLKLYYIEIEKQRRNTNAKQTLYFYREYGGREIDVIVEDYKKNYTALEIKITGEKAKDIFPLPHKFTAINTANYGEVITNAVTQFD